MPIWWGRARISYWSAARLRNEAESEVISAVSKGPNGNRMLSGNSHFISLIGVCEKHNRRDTRRGASRHFPSRCLLSAGCTSSGSMQPIVSGVTARQQVQSCISLQAVSKCTLLANCMASKRTRLFKPSICECFTNRPAYEKWGLKKMSGQRSRSSRGAHKALEHLRLFPDQAR